MMRSAGVVVVLCVGALLTNAVLVALPPGWDVITALVGAVAVLLVGRRIGLSWTQIGVSTDRVTSGLRWGGAAVLLVFVFYALVALLAPLLDAADDVAAPAGTNVWVTALVLVPLRTVLLEELAFRGVLWGFLERSSGQRLALIGTSVAFGFWHVAPALSLADRTDGHVLLSVVGVIIFTTVAGVVLGELRRRSGSVVAPMLLHWASNGLGLIVGYYA